MIQPPPWLADLPPLINAQAKSNRTLPGPAAFFAGWPGADMNRAVPLALRRKCAFCGCDITGALYHVVWNSPRPEEYPVEYPGGLFTMPSGPGHKSCLAFSVLVCPHLHKKDRGDAAIVGWRRYGIPFFKENQGEYGAPLFRFAYWDEAERTNYMTWKDVLPVFDDIVTADAKHVDTSTRWYWSDSIEDVRRRGSLLVGDRKMVHELRAKAPTTIGGHVYDVAELR